VATKNASLESVLLELINGSGFPFQMSVKKRIDDSSIEHRWKVVAEEHAWEHPFRSTSGFLDLVLQHQLDVIFRCTVECKRSKDAPNWVFLQGPDGIKDTLRLSTFWVNGSTERKTKRAWVNADFNPPSPESAFCIIPKNHERFPLLEKIADDLLTATEAIGLDEMSLTKVSGLSWGTMYFYVPIIITNSRLFIGTFDPLQMDLNTGILQDGDCELTEVPCVRFRKTLRTHFENSEHIPLRWEQLEPINENRKRTVLVINAGQLRESLCRLWVYESASFKVGRFIEQVSKLPEGCFDGEDPREVVGQRSARPPASQPRACDPT
jgi:hypothetical protein